MSCCKACLQTVNVAHSEVKLFEDCTSMLLEAIRALC